MPTVAQALGLTFHGQGDLRQQLLGYLRQKEMLLVLDNVEHLLTEHLLSEPLIDVHQRDGAQVVTDILRAAPDVRILITSRARLQMQSEQLLLVEGLAFPEGALPTAEMPKAEVPTAEAQQISAVAARYSAVTLFVHSACRVRPRFALTVRNLPHVLRICRLVQGMPLGILLAAAWVGLLSTAEIAQEIGKGLDFLIAEWHDMPARQRSMRAVIESMWTMLMDTERRTFARLSVFRGGFTREAAEQVAGAELQDLDLTGEQVLLGARPDRALRGT